MNSRTFPSLPDANGNGHGHVVTLPSPQAHARPLAGPVKFVDPWADLPDPDAPPPRAFSLRLVWRTLARYWWQLMLLWALGTLCLMALAYAYVKPTFDAFAIIEVQPPAPSVFTNDNRANVVDQDTYIQTQVQLITNTRVISAALSDVPSLATLPLLREAADVEAEVRKHLKVTSVPKTSLIQVGMTSANPAEAADIINSVVDAYIATNKNWTNAEAKEQFDRFEKMQAEAKAEVDRKQKAMMDLAATLKANGQEVSFKAEGDEKSLGLTFDRYQGLNEELFGVRLRRSGAEAQLELARQRMAKQDADASRNMQEEIANLLRANPDLVAMKREMGRLDRLAARAESPARRGNGPDPIGQQYRRQAQEAADGFLDHVAVLRNQYSRQLRHAATNDEAGLVDQLEAEVVKLRATEMVLDDRIKTIKVEKESTGDSGTKLLFAESDYHVAQRELEEISRQVKQLTLEMKTGSPIKERSKAKPTGNKRNDNRLRVMAVVPFLVGAIVLGLFVLVEGRAGRVSDPEDLPGRTGLNVVGVVPPLPELEAAAGGGGGALSTRSQARAQRRVEAFVQCLDHLRVAICDPSAVAHGVGAVGKRCVLITSAVGSEGKTTLAAQLAGRCANAGLSTLLIDADLRDPSLTWMLDLPQGPGLSELLMGQSDPEDVIVAVNEGGGFHLLPAGAPQPDPSRLFQQERLGALIARFRSMYDIVIIDSPPVLPVPDSLILARHADGVLLAVRHESSRYPLVERARQKLASVGAPIFGAVVNGARSTESAYGAYAYGSTTRYGSSDGANDGRRA